MKKWFLLLIFILPLMSCNRSPETKTFDNSVEPQKTMYVQKTPNQKEEFVQPLNMNTPKNVQNQQNIHYQNDQELKNYIINKYQYPKEWGERVTGVKTRLNTTDKVIALTLDACGGATGNAYDAELIYYLRQQNIPATLFINHRWIESNYWTAWSLNNIPLFEIENHGTQHRPLSINGKSAWGVKGTETVSQVVDEVLVNRRAIEQLTGRAPKFYRSGTAYYDEVAVSIVNELGEAVVNYNVLGDAGATFTKEQVRDALLSSKPGSIVLLHMNKPNSETAEGIKLAIPELKRRGYRFVKLEDYPLL